MSSAPGETGQFREGSASAEKTDWGLQILEVDPSGVLPRTPADIRETSDDLLAYLPCSQVGEFSAGQVIYGPAEPCASLYLLISGEVRVSRTVAGGQPLVIDVYLPDEVFGESAFAGGRGRAEEAVAIGAAKLMTWPIREVEQLVNREPRLGLALVRLLSQRAMDFEDRIESFSSDTVERRLVRSLIRFSERFGRESADGFVRMMPLTHEILAQYVGTAREIVTHVMTQLRREGYVQYSRREISIRREALRDWLKIDARRPAGRSPTA